MTNYIRSSKNNNVRYAIKLSRDAKYRKKNRNFIIDNIKLCQEVLKCNIKILMTFYTKDFYSKNSKFMQGLLNKTLKLSCLVDYDIIRAISDTQTPQGIICICEYVDNFDFYSKIILYNNIVILDDVQNPSNLGAIIRTCSALNFNVIAVTKNSCDIYNPKVLRSSAGGVFDIKFIEIDDTAEFINFLHKNFFKTYAMVVESDSKLINKVEFGDKIAVIFGNEGAGINKEVVKLCSERVKIPINLNVESLNVSVAVGIALWEINKKNFCEGIF